jgi:hypothetical protein
MESVMIKPGKVHSKKSIPAYLIKEEFDGVPLYYKGYKEVLAGRKTFEEIMAAGGLHSILVTYLTLLLGKQLNVKLFRVLVGEVGSKFEKRKKATLDVAVFEKSILPNGLINRHLISVPPLVDIEVDVSIENPNLSQDEVVQFRTQKLLDGGVQKVIWIFTLTQKIMVAENGKDWITFDWNRDVEIIDGIYFNIAKYLEEEGYDLHVLLG